MRNSSRWVPAYIVVLLVAAGLLGTLAEGDAAPVQAKLNPSERDTIPNIVGTWTGTWNDTVFFVERGLDWEITQNGQDVSGTGTIEMDYFGMGDKSGTGTGAITGGSPRTTLSFTFECADVGNGSGSIIAGGTGSGTGTVTAPLDFGDFTFQGTVTENTMRGTFDFVTAAGAGTVFMTKTTPVEPASWGEIKVRFRDDN